MSDDMTPFISQILCAVFFLSGASALIFETLWFRQAGLTFGNSVSASSLVLSAFMAGLALGNGLIAYLGGRIRRPVRFYAVLEVVIAVAGVALVWILPILADGLSPVLRPFLDRPWVLNPLRLTIGFSLLLIPSSAMGATLPILVKALREQDPNFGSVLGRLYGWNTSGAVLGAVAGEFALIEWFGVRGSAWVAAGLNGVSASVAIALSRALTGGRVEDELEGPSRASTLAWQLLAAAFLSGAVLLALEVVWFRFLHLFVHSSSLAFSLMLAVVLAGIGLGGSAGGLWLRRDPSAFRHASTLALLSGTLSVLLYYGFAYVLAPYATQYVGRASDILRLSIALTFPVSLLSGVLFTFTGTALNQELRPETRSAGLLTLANTVGAGLGSLCAGFLLLPLLGTEKSFFLLAALYGAVALLLVGARARALQRAGRCARYASTALFAVALVLFPFGMMEDHYFLIVARAFGYPQTAQIAGVREGRTETVLYLRNEFFGVPESYQMVTDGFNMASSSLFNRRYMKLFVYWPVALHPDVRRALLIGYGVGSTAKALTDTRTLEQIDVVDISRDVLEMNRVLYPDPADRPLKDPRVHICVEDGRYFLQTTENRYDLITGEPPPPRHAGVEGLYTREHFQLIYNRLAEGGINTYWLPVHTLTPHDTKAIIRAYCDVFKDCSLWAGAGFNWMLVGSRNAPYVRTEAEFRRQWEDPAVGPGLRALGIERPEQLGALFLSDARHLDEATRNTLPLVDDFPKRLRGVFVDRREQEAVYGPWMDADATRERFAASEFIRQTWPKDLRQRTLAYFDYQRILEESILGRGIFSAPTGLSGRIARLHTVLTESDLRTLPLWQLNLWDDLLRAIDALLAQGQPEDAFLTQMAGRALADRDFDRAADTYGRAQVRDPQNRALLYLRLYALCAAGRLDEAEGVLHGVHRQVVQDDPRFWTWMSKTFGLRIPIRP